MLDPRTSADLAALLAWYRDMGVDAPIGDTPIDWLSRGDVPPGAAFARALASAGASARPPLPEQKASSRQAAAPFAATPATPPPPDTERRGMPQGYAPDPGLPARRITAPPADAAVGAARAAVQQAGSLADLEAILARFDGCSLKATAKNLCFFRGSAKARLMIIGEAPGREEDQAGKPFVGRAGQLLDRMLAAIGLGEADVHITNVVYWRPPGNRTPTPLEAQVCRPFLERQAELVAPDLVLLLGGAAAKHIFDVPDGIMRIRGKLRPVTIGGHATQGLATLHPAYLLRTPAAKRLAWRDLLTARAALAR